MNTPLVTVRDYLRMFFRRKAALFAPILLAVIMTVPVWFLVPPTYQAVALVKRRDLAVLSNAPNSLIARGYDTIPIAALRDEILTFPSLSNVLRDLKMDVDIPTTAERQRKCADLKKAISIKAKTETKGIDTIEIAAISSNPIIAEQIANAIADSYVEQSNKSSRRDVESAVAFFQKNKDENLKKLRDVEMKLEKYRKENFVDLPEVKKHIYERLLGLRTQENANSLELIAAKNRLQEIDKQLRDVQGIVKGSVETQENPGAVELQNRRVALQKQLESMLLQLTAEHPSVKQVRNELGLIENQLQEMPARIQGVERQIINPVYEQLTKDKLAVQQGIRGHEASIEAVRAQIAANEAEIKAVQEQETNYNDLVRQQDEYNTSYSEAHRTLLAHTARLQVETDPQSGTQVELLERALAPISPYRKGRILMALGCLAIGAAIGVGLMFTLEACDHSLRGADDAAHFLKIPVLCSLSEFTLPEVEARRRGRRNWLIASVIVLFVLLAAAAVTVSYVWPEARMEAIRFVQNFIGVTK